MSQIVRERTRPGLRMVEASGFPACIAVFRPKEDVYFRLVVVSADEPTATLRGMSRLILAEEHHRQLSRFLSDRRRKR